MKTNGLFRSLIGLLFAYCAFLSPSFAQVENNLEIPTSIRADGNNPDPSAMLDVQSTAKGVLIPRMTTGHREGIANPANGLLVYDTDTGTFWYFETSWTELLSSSGELANDSNNTLQNIPDNNPTGITSSINLSSNRQISGATIIEVCLDITHTYTGDLNISLRGPDGTTIELSTDNGGSGDNYTNTCFRSDAVISIASVSAPFNGVFLPEDSFSAFDGKLINGTWTLEISDDASPDVGTLNSWSLRMLTAVKLSNISDADGDSRATVEGTPDEDAFRVVLSGIQPFSITSQGSSIVDLSTEVLGSMTVGGTSNIASGSFSAIVGGNSHQVTGNNSVIAGGTSNEATSSSSGVVAGQSNDAFGVRVFVGGGFANRGQASDAFVGGGQSNIVSGSRSAIVAGQSNQATGNNTFIGGGRNSEAPSYSEAVVGLYPTTYTASSLTSWNALDRVFTVGNGSSTSNRNNALTILKNGNVGIEEDNPEVPLHIIGGSDTRVDAGGYLQTGNTNGANLNIDENEIMARNNGTFSTIFINREGGDIVLANAGSGDVGVGRTPTTNDLEVNGTASKSSAGDWLANSDARLKKNIKHLDSKEILQRMLRLKGITYEWNDQVTENDRPIGIQYGFTAQNIQEVFPALVFEDEEGYLQTAYGTYDAMYVEAIRALLERIEALEAENETLQSKVSETDQLKARLDRLEALLQQIPIEKEKDVSDK